MAIHPTAIVDSAAELDPSVEVGPYAIIHARVRIGADSRIFAHAYIDEYTTIGERCAIHPFAVLGHYPQDIAWSGAPSYTVIGDDTIIREHAQVHRGTKPGTTTRIGNRVFMMAGAHVAHNCEVGDNAKLTSGVLLGGYVKIGPSAFLGGGAAVHQFCRVGELVIVHGQTSVMSDVPPFMMATEHGCVGLNQVGLRRAEVGRDARNELRWAYKTLFRSGLTKPQAVARVAQRVQTPEGKRLLAFLQEDSLRGMMRYRESSAGSE